MGIGHAVQGLANASSISPIIIAVIIGICGIAFYFIIGYLVGLAKKDDEEDK